MNQDAFRNLIQTEKSTSGPTPASRGSLLRASTKPKAKVIASSEPAFKPRKVKNASETYRDRAEERRAGKEGDYAQIEAILEEFEKRNAENEDRAAVDAQRRYLGGDSDHSILVKGLDFALLEQNKARLASATSKQDDEALEDVFMQAASTSTAPPVNKRSRADIIKELKGKRTNEGNLEQPKEEAVAENRPDSSKFRPIGFKPIGASAMKKAKKGIGEPKKKKRKVEHSATNIGEQTGSKDDATLPTEQNASTSGPRQAIVPEPVEDDFDIFADAGEYKGIDFGSDDDNSDTGQEKAPQPGPSVARAENGSTPLRRDWFGGEVEPEVPPSEGAVEQDTPVPETRIETEEEQSATLVPLASSAMPSIRDFLAMDEAVVKDEKRNARKEKRKGKNK